MLSRIPALAARHPLKVVLIVLVLTGLAAATLPRLGLHGGIYELFPARSGPVSDLAIYGRLFGAQQELVILVTGSAPAQVERATRQTAIELSRSPLIEEVRAGVEGTDLAVGFGRSLLLLAGPGTWERVKRRLTDPGPQVRRLRRLLLSPITPGRDLLARDPLGLSELLLRGEGAMVDRRTGRFSSPDGRAALVFARPRGRPSDLAFCERLNRELLRVRDQVEAESGEGGRVKVQLTGGYQYAFHISRALRGDLTISGVAALVGAVVVLLLFFRSLRLIPLAALLSLVAVVWTLGIAAVTVGRLNALSMAFAALCIGLGLDGLIHVTARTRQFAARPASERPLRAIQVLAPAMLVAAVTTITAFLTFSFSSFAGLSHTGLLSACGLAFVLGLTLVLVPALGALSSRLSIPVQGDTSTRVDRWLSGLVGVAVRGRWAILCLCVAWIPLALFVAGGLRFSDDLTKLAPSDLPPSRTDQAIAERFERHRSRLIVMIGGDDRERVLQINDRLAEKLEHLRGKRLLAEYRSLSGLLPSRATQRRRRARVEALQPRELVRRLEAELEAMGLRAAAFEPFYRTLIDPAELTLEKLPRQLEPVVRRHLVRDGSRTVVSTILYPPRSATRRSVERLASQLSGLAGGGVEVKVTGAGLAGQQMAKLLREDLVLVSLLSLAVVLVMLGLLLRRPRAVGAALLSLWLTGLTFVAVAALIGLEIELYNLMVLPILVGYGVDDHIYIARRAVTDGVRRAVVESGRAVVATTLTSMVAFGALCLCSVDGLRVLGKTAMLGLALALICSLVVMPALLSLGKRSE